MATFRVYVTGTLDYDYEVNARDAYEAEDEAISRFEKEHPNMWSGIDVYEVEELYDES